MTRHDAPSVTSLICTRNRGHLVSGAVRSVLANTHPNFELVVVDQSSNDETARALVEHLSDRRLKYIRSPTVGKGMALSVGLSESTGPIVALTDDDCVVPPNWLETFDSIFAKYPKVAVTFCIVDAAEHDPTLGFVPAYVPNGDRLSTSVHDARHVHGLGAGMAMRRSMVNALGGIDTTLGPGSMFPSCEDRDIAIRSLLAGYHVYDTASTTVEHFGFRSWQEGRELTRRDFVAIGAVYSKFFKCGRVGLIYIPAMEFVRFALWPPIRDLLHLQKPRGVTRITAFIDGLIRGLRTPFDKSTMKFIDQRSISLPKGAELDKTTVN